MERYTIQQLKNLPIQIECHNNEQANKIWKVYGQKDYWNIGDGKKEFYIFTYLEKDTYFKYPSWMPDSQYFPKEYGVNKTIEFSQIDFQEELETSNLYIW